MVSHRNTYILGFLFLLSLLGAGYYYFFYRKDEGPTEKPATTSATKKATGTAKATTSPTEAASTGAASAVTPFGDYIIYSLGIFALITGIVTRYASKIIKFDKLRTGSMFVFVAGLVIVAFSFTRSDTLRSGWSVALVVIACVVFLFSWTSPRKVYDETKDLAKKEINDKDGWKDWPSEADYKIRK